MGNLPNPMAKKNAEGRVEICPQRPSACDEFQLVIPWRVALQQSPPLLHQPLGSMRYSSLARLEFFSERHSVSYSLVSPEGSTSSHYSVSLLSHSLTICLKAAKSRNSRWLSKDWASHSL